MKQKKCRACGEKFKPWSSTQVACSAMCAMKVAEQKKEKERKEWVREEKQRLKSRGDYAKEAQAAFNKFIRLRDSRFPCISCGRHHEGQYHAGHYRSVGAAPELRFEELNCHKQCAPCNNHKSGNIVEYRIELTNRIGAEKVEWLEGPHEPKKYTIDQLKEIKAKYNKKAKELENG